MHFFCIFLHSHIPTTPLTPDVHHAHTLPDQRPDPPRSTPIPSQINAHTLPYTRPYPPIYTPIPSQINAHTLPEPRPDPPISTPIPSQNHAQTLPLHSIYHVLTPCTEGCNPCGARWGGRAALSLLKIKKNAKK